MKRKIQCVFGLICCLVLTGCHDRSGDENLPKPAQALGCPDLNGTYELPNAGLDLDPRRWVPDAQLQTWQSFSLHSIVPGAPVHINLRRDQNALESEVKQFRAQQAKAYKVWREKASLSYLERGVARQAHYEALAELGPTPEMSFSSGPGTCIDNWFQFPGDARHDEDHRALALDEDGNLLIRAAHVTRSEFPIWCGDGCKGIPYAWHTAVTWTRAKRLPDLKPWVWTLDDGEPEAEAPLDRSGQEDRDPRVGELRQRVFAALPAGTVMFNFYMRSEGVIFSGTCPTRADLDSIKKFLQRDPLVDSVLERRAWETNRGEIDFALEIPLKEG